MNCETRFFTRDTKGDTYYLGRMSGFPDNERLPELVSEMLSFNPYIEPEEGACIHLHDTHGGDIIIFTCWLAKDKFPGLKSKYLGLNPPEKRHKLLVEAACYDFYVGAYFVDVVVNLAYLCNLDKIKLKDNEFLRFIMNTEELYLPSYVYRYVKPKSSITIAVDVANQCPSDSYLIETCDSYRAYFYAIKKEKYDSSDKLLPEDFLHLD